MPMSLQYCQIGEFSVPRTRNWQKITGPNSTNPLKPQRAMGLVNERGMGEDNNKIWSAAVTKSDDSIGGADDADYPISDDDNTNQLIYLPI